jgi:tetratricopeptide (TPR) repeat protein
LKKADARQIGLWNTSALTLILKANDFQQALNVLESFIAKVPNYLDALNNYGVCLMHNEKVRNTINTSTKLTPLLQLEEAALCFNTVLNSNNEHIEALNNLSLILACWNKYVSGHSIFLIWLIKLHSFEDAVFMANRAYEMASTQKKNELDNMCHDLEDHEDSSLSSTLLFIANNLCCFHLQIGDTNAVTKITEDVSRPNKEKTILLLFHSIIERRRLEILY